MTREEVAPIPYGTAKLISFIATLCLTAVVGHQFQMDWLVATAVFITLWSISIWHHGGWTKWLREWKDANWDGYYAVFYIKDGKLAQKFASYLPYQWTTLPVYKGETTIYVRVSGWKRFFEPIHLYIGEGLVNEQTWRLSGIVYGYAGEFFNCWLLSEIKVWLHQPAGNLQVSMLHALEIIRCATVTEGGRITEVKPFAEMLHVRLAHLRIVD